MKYDLYTCTVHISIHPTKCMSIVFTLNNYISVHVAYTEVFKQ